MQIIQATATRILELMKLQNISIEVLAEKSNVTVLELTSILNCSTNKITAQTIFHICRGFGIELADFFKSELFQQASK